MTRHMAAALLKEYTVKLSAIHFTKLLGLYKMPISMTETLAFGFVCVSGFIEAGKTVEFIPDKVEEKQMQLMGPLF